MIEVLGTKGLIKFVRLTFAFFGREFYHVFKVFRNVLNLQGKLYGPCAFLYLGIVHVDRWRSNYACIIIVMHREYILDKFYTPSTDDS